MLGCEFISIPGHFPALFHRPLEAVSEEDFHFCSFLSTCEQLAPALYIKVSELLFPYHDHKLYHAAWTETTNHTVVPSEVLWETCKNTRISA